MATKEERYAAIAATMRKQRFPDFPLKHEWVELLTRLCRDDNHHLREIGISELSHCAERSTQNRKV